MSFGAGRRGACPSGCSGGEPATHPGPRSRMGGADWLTLRHVLYQQVVYVCPMRPITGAQRLINALIQIAAAWTVISTEEGRIRRLGVAPLSVELTFAAAFMSEYLVRLI